LFAIDLLLNRNKNGYIELLQIFKARHPFVFVCSAAVMNSILYHKLGCHILLVQYQHQITTKYTKWPLNIAKGHKINIHFPFQGPHKYTRCFWNANISSGNPATKDNFSLGPNGPLESNKIEKWPQF
jgi:hypothetical protein